MSFIQKIKNKLKPRNLTKSGLVKAGVFTKGYYKQHINLNSRRGVFFVVSFALTGAAVVYLVLASGFVASDEQDQISRTNNLRSSQNVTGLANSGCLTNSAREWSQRMSAEGRLFHSTEGGGLDTLINRHCGLPAPGEGKWEVIGENVGYGGNSQEIFEALKASAAHYKNMVDGRFNFMGVGAYRDDAGRLWITQHFARCVNCSSNWGSAPTPPPPAPPPAAAPNGVGTAMKPDRTGHWIVEAGGRVVKYGSAVHYGDMAGRVGNIIGITSSASGNGYWLLGSDGGIFAFGDAVFYGSTGGQRLNAPIVAMAAHPSGGGYWLVASDGGVFSFASSQFKGSMGGQRLNKPIVTMASTPSGNGYWLVGSDGGIFAFGDAAFFGSTGNIPLNSPIIAMTSTTNGQGYWLIARDGGIFAYGNAVFYGSTGNLQLPLPVVGFVVNNDNAGYYVIKSDGTGFGFGSARSVLGITIETNTYVPTLSFIQGYKVAASGTSDANLEGAAITYIEGGGPVANSTIINANPYRFDVNQTEHRVNADPAPPGWRLLGYSLCINAIDCHNIGAEPWRLQSGNSAYIDLRAGDGSWADLWWHYEPDSTSPPAGQPDLQVSQVTWTPGSPQPGDNVSFQATIVNLGTAATPDGVIHGVLFKVDGVVVGWNASSVTSLASGGSRVLVSAEAGPNGNGTWTATAGSHTVEAFVDDVNRITNESNETNNQLTANLVVGSTSTSTNAPTNLHATSVSSTAVAISWNPPTTGPGVASYTIYRNNIAYEVRASNQLSFNDTAVVADTTYTYEVVANDIVGATSPRSNAITITIPGTSSVPNTPPTVPTNLRSTSATASTIGLAWSASTDDKGVRDYYIYRNGILVAIMPSQFGTAATDYNLSPSTTYVYAVSAVDYDGAESARSGQINATTLPSPDTTPPSAPSNFTATAASSTKVSLSWTASTDNVAVVKYYVSRAIGTGTATVISEQTGTAYNDITAIANTTYTYSVVAVDGANNVSPSAVKTLTTPQAPDTTPPTPPTNLIAAVASSTQVNLTWSSSTDTGGSGLAGYNILRNGTKIATSLTTSYGDGTAQPGTSYVYTVTAYDGSGNTSGSSNTANISTPQQAGTITTSQAPQGNWVDAYGKDGYALLAWNNDQTDLVSMPGVTLTTNGALRYQWNAGTTEQRALQSPDKSSRRATTAYNNTPFDIKLNFTSAYSGNLHIYAVDWDTLDRRQSLTINDAAGSRTVSMSGSFNNGLWVNTPISVANGGTVTISVTYVNGYNAVISGIFLGENAQLDTTPPTAPISLQTAAAPAYNKVDLKWTASTSTDTVKYTVLRNNIAVGSSTGTTFSDTSVSASTSYAYTVKAVDAANNVSVASNQITVSTPASPDTAAPNAPANVTGTASATQVALTWTASTDNVGVSKYYVYRGGTVVAQPTGTSFTDNSVTASTAYSYYVRAVDAAGNLSPVSNTYNVTTLAPPTSSDTTPPSAPSSLVATIINSNQVNLGWTAATDNVGVARYEIYRNGIKIGTSTTTSYGDATVRPNASYSYYIKAVDTSNNTGPSSNTVNVSKTNKK